MNCSAAKKSWCFRCRARFTPTCSKEHLPGFVDNADAIKAKGVDTIACMAVNDMFVMDAWGASAGAGDKVLMLADGNGTYTAALGLELDGSGFRPGHPWPALRHGSGRRHDQPAPRRKRPWNSRSARQRTSWRTCNRERKLAGGRGFEPLLAESESAVLPFRRAPICTRFPIITRERGQI